MYKKNIVYVFYIVLAFMGQYKLLHADVKLLGYIHNDQGFMSDAPLGWRNVWKAFRYQATVNGRMDYFIIYLGGFADTLETDNEVAWAIYEDNNLHVGTHKISGYVAHYDWTIIGPGENHTFPLTTVHQNRDIIAGNYYWVTFHATGGNNILISRGRVSGCDSNLKYGTNQYSWQIFNPPPPPQEFVNQYNPGCYGWAVWQADSNNTAPTILNTIEDVFENEDFGSLIIADLDTIFYDADSLNGDSLRFLSTTLIGLVNTEISGSELRISSINNSYGNETAVVTATDNSFASISDTFLVTINPVPDPPLSFNLLMPPNGTNLIEIDTINFLWQSSFDVDNDPLNYELNLRGAARETILTNISDTLLQFLNQEFFEENSQYNWYVNVNDGLYLISSIDTFVFFTPSLNAVNNFAEKIPENYKLYQNFPNPFNPITRIKFGLPERSDVIMEIYNILGQKMMTFIEENKDVGFHQVEFNFQNLTSGIYLYILKAGEFQDMKKMILMK